MLQNHKKLLASLVAFLLLLSISWFALFEYGTRWLKKEVEIASLELRQRGYSVSYSNIEFRGTPFSIEANVQNPHIKDPKGLFEWNGQSMKVSIRPWNLYTFMITLPDDQKISASHIPFGILSLEGTHGILKLTHRGVF